MEFDYDTFCRKLDGKSSEEALADIDGKMEYFAERLDEAMFSTSQTLRSKAHLYKVWKNELTDLYEAAKTLKKGQRFSAKDRC